MHAAQRDLYFAIDTAPLLRTTFAQFRLRLYLRFACFFDTAEHLIILVTDLAQLISHRGLHPLYHSQIIL